MFTDAEEEGYEPPFRIVNLCSRTVSVQQSGISMQLPRKVLPGAALPYVWDAPLGAKELSIDFCEVGSMFKSGAEVARVRLDLLRGPMQHENGHDVLWTAVTLAGSTRVLTIWDQDPEHPLRLARSAEQCEWLLESPRQPRHALSLSFRGVGVSIVHSAQFELAYLFLSSCALVLEGTATDERVRFTVGALQLDNQLPAALLPVVLSCRPRGTALLELHGLHEPRVPGIEVVTVRKLFGGAAGPVFQSADVLLHAMELQLEERFVKHVGALLDDVQAGLAGGAHAGAGAGAARAGTPPRPAEGGGAAARPAVWYFGRLSLSPIQVSVSYMSSQRMIQELLRNPVHIPSVSRLPLTLNAIYFDVSARAHRTAAAASSARAVRARAAPAHCWRADRPHAPPAASALRARLAALSRRGRASRSRSSRRPPSSPSAWARSTSSRSSGRCTSSCSTSTRSASRSISCAASAPASRSVLAQGGAAEGAAAAGRASRRRARARRSLAAQPRAPSRARAGLFEEPVWRAPVGAQGREERAARLGRHRARRDLRCARAPERGARLAREQGTAACAGPPPLVATAPRPRATLRRAPLPSAARSRRRPLRVRLCDQPGGGRSGAPLL